tara:strand:+ start:91 stop:342 length:252 start_codon:yes stop_codon:yes gene_type:complete
MWDFRLETESEGDVSCSLLVSFPLGGRAFGSQRHSAVFDRFQLVTHLVAGCKQHLAFSDAELAYFIWRFVALAADVDGKACSI